MKKQSLLFILILFCASISAQSSSKRGKVYLNWKTKVNELCPYIDKDKAAALYNNSISSLRKDQILGFNKAIGDCLASAGEKKAAIDYYKNALAYVQSFSKIGSEINASLSSCYYKARDFEQVKTHANVTVKNHEKGIKSLPPFIEALKNIAYVDRDEGNVVKAKGYFDKAIALAIKEYGEVNMVVALLYKESGQCFDLSKDFDIALIRKTKALEVAKKAIGHKNTMLAYYYTEIGLTYQKMDKYEEAIKIHNQALELIRNGNQVEEDILKTISVYNRLGNCYYFLEQYDRAAKIFIEVLPKYIDFYGSSHSAVCDLYAKIGACYTNVSQYSKAAIFIDSALMSVNFDEKKSHPFEISSSKTSLLITLYFKAKNNFKIYGQSGCEEDLQLAHEGYDLCIRLIDYMTRSFDEGDSKQYLLDRFYYIFESIIEVNYQCYALRGEQKYIDRALCYMEKSRGILLKEIMQNARASIVAGIPENLLEQERQWRKHIVELENRRYELEEKAQVNAAFHELGDSLFLLREQHQRLLQQMERDFPRYYELKYADHSAEVPAVLAQLLKPQEALVQYFVGDDNIYTIVYRTDGGSHFVKAPKDELDEAIAALRENIYAYVLSASDSLAMAYAAGAHQLYNKLLQPVSAHLPNRFTIIPDGLLEYLPFEALLTAPATEQMNFRAYPYCVRKYSISYAYSVLSLAEMQQRNNAPRYRQILAVAPSFPQVLAVRDAEDRRRSFGALQDNATEVAGITRLFPAKTLSGTDATLKNFEALAGDYAVLHLATHAKADNENGEHAYIAFTEVPDTAQGSLLYLKDLYALRLHADMVVLSACETGVGALRRGEGVLSLARGFSYAGANSLITTLWRVSDKESAALMTSFYEGLKEGMAKDEALRQAKISYLDQSSGNRAHPFFWAAFTTIGDTEPLQIPQNAWMWWLLALLPLPAWVVWKKRKPQIAA